MIAIALPDIVRALRVDLVSATWLITLYLIAMAALQPVGGKLGDTFGRRRLLLGSLAWFGVASLGAALATELAWLIAFRLLQALAGAVMFPNAGALVRAEVGERRGTAYALIAAATGTGAAAGPVLGGLLVATFGWQATFLVNLPLVGFALAFAHRSIPPDGPRAPGQFDTIGAVWLSTLLALGAWILGRLRSETAAMTAALVALLVLAAAAFARYERGRSDAIIRPDLFRDRTFAAANGAIALGNLAMYGTMLAVPVVLARSADGAGAALGSGLALSALFVTSVALSPLGGRYADRVGRRWPAVTGYAIFAAGSLALAVAPPAAFIPALMLCGVGLGVSAGGLRAAAVESVDRVRAGLASGIFSTSRYAGGIAGALLVSLLVGDEGAGALHAVCAAGAVGAAACALLLEDWPGASP
jgi:MFS family permease